MPEEVEADNAPPTGRGGGVHHPVFRRRCRRRAASKRSSSNPSTGPTPTAYGSCPSGSTMPLRPRTPPARGPPGPRSPPRRPPPIALSAGSSRSSAPTGPSRPWPNSDQPTMSPTSSSWWAARAAPRGEVVAGVGRPGRRPRGVRSLHHVDPQPHELLSSYYRAADVCIVPSRSESFGLVALPRPPPAGHRSSPRPSAV